MQWLRTIILFDQGDVISSETWKRAHESYVRAIQAIDHPRGSGTLGLRRISKDKKSRNGVSYLKNRFVEHMGEQEWLTEARVKLKSGHDNPMLRTYPDMKEHVEPVTARFGGFDFMSVTPDGVRVAIEWETGNISSSHRSLNKLSLALSNGDIQVGVLVVPSRDMYFHMTDRVGNIGELSPYLAFWERTKHMVTSGLLAVTVVEHDHLSDDEELPYLSVGRDGRAREGQLNRAKLAPKTDLSALHRT